MICKTRDGNGKSCACVSKDAKRCLEIRIYGYSPVLFTENDTGECQCPCHKEEEEKGE